MLLSSIVKVSNCEIGVIPFKDQIKDEVAHYKALLKKKGGNIPIVFKEDAELLSINFKQLLQFIKEGQFDEYEASYIADALTLSESYDSINENDAYLIESTVLDF